MVSAKLFLRPNPLPSISFSPPTHFLFIKPKFTATTFAHFATSATAAGASSNQYLPYGPSLLRGKTPEIPQAPKENQQENETKTLVDKSQFTRIFDVATLRVPAKVCYALESRLRGHLLNWPRVRNIARVPGDDMETEFVDLLADNENVDSDEAEEELNSVLYREKLVKNFNFRGYVKFRNLAKISRPRRRKRKESKEESKGNRGKEEAYVVEVVEEEGKEMKGLLGEEFRGGEKWKGATRLLLLDEGLVDKNVKEFPAAIKAVLEEDTGENTTPTLELVRCRLTLFYGYWQMNEILEALLPKGMIVPSAFETVGHIAHLNLRDEHQPYKYLIAQILEFKACN